MSLRAKYKRLLQEAFGDEDSSESFIHPVREQVLERGDTHIVARGDDLLDDGEESQLKSELPDVSDDKWSQFVRNMASSKLDAVSPSNALGLFMIMPRRLADLGVVRKLARKKSPQGRTVWVAIFVQPLTCDAFLKRPDIQYRVFCSSIKDYNDKMERGEIERDPEMSKSGALAILHRAGPSGLETWKNGDRFDETMKSYERVAGIF